MSQVCAPSSAVLPVAVPAKGACSAGYAGPSGPSVGQEVGSLEPFAAVLGEAVGDVADAEANASSMGTGEGGAPVATALPPGSDEATPSGACGAVAEETLPEGGVTEFAVPSGPDVEAPSAETSETFLAQAPLPVTAGWPSAVSEAPWSGPVDAGAGWTLQECEGGVPVSPFAEAGTGVPSEAVNASPAGGNAPSMVLAPVGSDATADVSPVGVALPATGEATVVPSAVPSAGPDPAPCWADALPASSDGVPTQVGASGTAQQPGNAGPSAQPAPLTMTSADGPLSGAGAVAVQGSSANPIAAEVAVLSGGNATPRDEGSPMGQTSPWATGSDEPSLAQGPVVAGPGPNTTPDPWGTGGGDLGSAVSLVMDANAVLDERADPLARPGDGGSQEALSGGVGTGGLTLAKGTTGGPAGAEVSFVEQLAEASEPLEVDGRDVAFRVASAMRTGLAQGTQRMLVRLEPPELGQLRVDVQMKGGDLVANLETETSAARAAILEGLDVLRGKLASQGIQVREFEVRVAATPSDAEGFVGGDPTGGQTSSQQWEPSGYGYAYGPDEPDTEVVETEAWTGPGRQWSLNVVA